MNLRASAIALTLVASLSCKKEAAETPKPDPAKEAPAGKDPGKAAPPAAAPTGAKLVHVPPKVGDKRTKREEMSMEMKLEVQPGKTVEMKQHKTEVESMEVLEVDGGVEKKAKFTFVEHKATQEMAGKTKEDVPPTVGKTYVVARDGDTIQVFAEDGKTVPPAPEVAAVEKDKKSFGRPDGEAMSKLIASKSWKIGERVDFTPEEVAQVSGSMGGGGETSVTAMSFTLKSNERDVATFDMTMVMNVTTPDGAMKMDLAGTAVVDSLTSRPKELTAEGPVTGTMKGIGVNGKMRVKTTYE